MTNINQEVHLKLLLLGSFPVTISTIAARFWPEIQMLSVSFFFDFGIWPLSGMFVQNNRITRGFAHA